MGTENWYVRTTQRTDDFVHARLNSGLLWGFFIHHFSQAMLVLMEESDRCNHEKSKSIFGRKAELFPFEQR